MLCVRGCPPLRRGITTTPLPKLVAATCRGRGIVSGPQALEGPPLLAQKCLQGCAHATLTARAAAGWPCSSSRIRRLSGVAEDHVLDDVLEQFENLAHKKQVDAKSVTHFDILGLPCKFAVDDAELESAYKALQRQLHPDKHAGSSADILSRVENYSADVNEAVAVLRSTLKRAAYWMELNGVRVLEDDQRMQDMETMMEVMEVSEEIDDATSQAEIDALAERNSHKVRGIEAEVAAAIDQEDWKGAHVLLERLQMFSRVGERLRDWRRT